MGKSRKTIRKRKKLRKTQKGRGVIGYGMSGIVHYPALQCKDPSKNPPINFDTYVSKVSSTKSAQKEFEMTSKVRELKDYSDFIIPEYICEYNDNQSLLFSKYGGYTLVQYHAYLEKLAYTQEDKSEFDEPYYKNIIKALDTLKKKVQYMNDNGIYQGDISFDNVLYNEDEKRAYLIDFERGGKKADETVLVQDLIDEFEKMKRKIDSRK